MSTMDEEQKLVLIDGHAMFYRAFFAFPQSLTTRRGELVNAVYGFTRILLSVIEQLEPTHITVSFDVGETFRHKEYKEYKAHREKMPDELKEQEPRVYEMCGALNIPVVTKDNYEADDVIGTLATRAARVEKVRTMIVTGDMDTLQLVRDRKSDNESVMVYVPGRGQKAPVVYDEKEVRNRYGLTPEQIVDMKGLAGDSSDNIPGIKGIGEKTAVKLLQVFGSVEGIYEYLDSKAEKVGGGGDEEEEVLKPAVLKKLLTGKGAALESKYLATIVTDVAIEWNLEDSLVKKYDKEVAVKLFEELEFNSLISKLPNDDFEESVQEMLF